MREFCLHFAADSSSPAYWRSASRAESYERWSACQFKGVVRIRRSIKRRQIRSSCFLLQDVSIARVSRIAVEYGSGLVVSSVLLGRYRSVGVSLGTSTRQRAELSNGSR